MLIGPEKTNPNFNRSFFQEPPVLIAQDALHQGSSI